MDRQKIRRDEIKMSYSKPLEFILDKHLRSPFPFRHRVMGFPDSSKDTTYTFFTLFTETLQTNGLRSFYQVKKRGA